MLSEKSQAPKAIQIVSHDTGLSLLTYQRWRQVDEIRIDHSRVYIVLESPKGFSVAYLKDGWRSDN